MFTIERSVGRDILRLLVAVIDVAAGVVAVVYPGMTAEVLTIVVGFWAIFGGSVELAGAFTGRSGWLGVAGLLTVAAGVVLIAAPGIGAVSLALIFGIYLLVLRDHVAGVGGEGGWTPERQHEGAPRSCLT